MSNVIASWLADPRLSFLLGLGVRSLVVPALGASILFLLGRRASASVRYLVMLVCMLGLLGLPLLSVVTPAWRVPVLPASLPQVTTHASPAGNPSAVTGTSALLMQQSPVAAMPISIGQGMVAAGRKTSKSGSLAHPATLSSAGWVILLWLGGAALYGGWLLLGRLRLWRLAQRCPVVAGGPLHSLIQDLAIQCGVHATLVVRQAAREDDAFVTPMTWGWLRPVLLMPGGVLEEWPAERLQAVLLHELAHIARYDWLTLVVTQLSCALYWFNPLVWKLAGAMEREAEQACDDRVLLAGVQASDYAGHLLEVVKSLQMLHGAVLQGGAQTMAAPRSNIQARLIAILAADRNRAQTSRRAALVALALSVVALAPLAALHPARAAGSERLKAATDHADGDPDNMATQWSWRGDWAKAAVDADAVLKDRHASDSRRANAYWIKFESAWWMDNPAESDRNFQLFAALAGKHPDDPTMQANLQTANRYRSSAAPKSLSNEELQGMIRELFQQQDYADTLHYARYMLNRPNVPTQMQTEALMAGYAGARYWEYKDTQALLSRQFQVVMKRLPVEKRDALQQAWKYIDRMVQPHGSADEVNPVSGTAWKRVKLDGPTNLDFHNGTTGWTIGAEDGSGADYQMGVDPHGAPDGPAAYLTAKNDHPKGDAALSQTCRADAFRGKRIRYSALVRTEGVEKGAEFYLHLDAPDRVRTWNQLDKPILGTTDWKRYEYVVDVAQNNQGFIFGVGIEGKGKVWVRDCRFEVVDQNMPVTPAGNNFAITNNRISADDSTTEAGLPEQPVNFQFKNGLEGWFNDNPEHTSERDYQIEIDKQVTYNGHTAALLSSRVNHPRSYGTLMQNIRADAYRGKRIRYSASLKTQADLKTQAAVEGGGFWIVLMAANPQESNAWNMTAKPIRGTTDWKRYHWVLDVPQDAKMLSFGIDLTGKGKVWVSDFQIEVVGNDVPLTPSTE